MRREAKRFLVGVSIATATFSVAMGAAWFAGFRLNTTASLPVGVWRLIDGPPKRGDYVLFEPDLENETVKWGRAVGILPWRFGKTTPLLKRIIAEPGDRITLDGAVAVNGVPVPHGRIFERDQAGRLIPHTARAGIVPVGSWWLMSDEADRSFDSRYFGAVSQTAVIARAQPVWLW